MFVLSNIHYLWSLTPDKFHSPDNNSLFHFYCCTFANEFGSRSSDAVNVLVILIDKNIRLLRHEAFPQVSFADCHIKVHLSISPSLSELINKKLWFEQVWLLICMHLSFKAAPSHIYINFWIMSQIFTKLSSLIVKNFGAEHEYPSQNCSRTW